MQAVYPRHRHVSKDTSGLTVILSALKKKNPRSRAELRAWFIRHGLAPGSVDVRLNEALKRGLIERGRRGLYRLPE
jgi:hypothetical protein